MNAAEIGELEHKHSVGDVLEKPDTSKWEITNRMFDVDTGEKLYRFRENGPGLTQETEIFTGSEVERIFTADSNLEPVKSK